MPGRDIFVIGASAGGVEAYRKLVKQLPERLGASLFLVLHFSVGRSYLPEILSRESHFPVTHAKDREVIERDHIYVAPPGFHMLVKPGFIRIIQGPMENHSRPAIDPLFRSAAVHYGKRVAGIILTGTMSDGATGLRQIVHHGGIAIIQDPAEAFFPEMPENALRAAKVSHVLRVAEIAKMLGDLPKNDIDEYKDTSDMAEELDILELNREELENKVKSGISSGLVCPECGGGLWEHIDGDTADYRCRVGHAHSRQSFDMAVTARAEDALWSAIRLLEEKEEVELKLAKRMEELQNEFSAARFLEQARKARDDAELIRKLLVPGRKEAKADERQAASRSSQSMD